MSIEISKEGKITAYQGLNPKEINQIINKVLDQTIIIVDTNKMLLEALAQPTILPYIVDDNSE